MVRDNQTLVRMSGWAGGLNTESDPFLIQQSESASMLNVDIGITGEIEKRKGYSKWSTSDHADMARGQHLWHLFNGTNNFWIMQDQQNRVWHVNTDSATTFTRSAISGPTNVDLDFNCDAIVMNNILYVAGTTLPSSAYKFDGSTWTKITDNTLDGSGTEFPLCSVLHVRGDLVFAGNISSTSSRIHWSDPGAPETWPTNNFIEVDKDDGGVITGLATFKDILLIFKNQALWGLAGTDNSTFTLFSISERFGAFSNLSIVSFGDQVIWFDVLNGVMAYDGSDVEAVDRKINSRILDNADLSDSLRTVKAFGLREKYYLSMDWTPTGARRTFVFDLRTKAWTEYDYGPYSVAQKKVTDSALYAVQATDALKGVWKLFDTENDESSAVSSSFETPWFTPGEGPMQEHRLLKMIPYLRAEGGSSAINITIELYTNYDNDTVVESVTVNVNDSDADQIFNRIIHFEDKTANVFQLKITHNTTGEQWQLNAIDFLFLDRNTPPGVNV